ncbi:MAG: DUF480 domain-containing protein [Solirubrobacteraceae bacterium]
MRFTELTDPEQRVLGCLLEKRFTTPDQYPLSLNSLRLACNQATNRNPVTAYDEATVRDAAQRLCKHGLARLASGHTSRSIKYRHLAEEALSLDRPQLALLTVLLLRGAQTPGELKGRSERMAHIESLEQVEEIMATLVEREMARRIGRRPGQKEDRFEHLLGRSGREGQEVGPAVTASADPDARQAGAAQGSAAGHAAWSSGHGAPPQDAPPARAPAAGPAGEPDGGADRSLGPLEERVRAFGAEVASLRAQVAVLREELADLRRRLGVGQAS